MPLAARKRAARVLARRRIAARTTRAMDAKTRAADPTDHPRLSPAEKTGRVAGAVGASLAAHAGIVLVAILVAGFSRTHKHTTHDRIVVHVREHKPKPKPKPKPTPKVELPAPTAPKEPKPERKPPPKITHTRPKPPPPTEPPPKAPPRPPRRVIGINMSSTTTGGNGPAFSAGNSRGGETQRTASDPDKVPPTGESPTGTTSPNKAATRIPTGGVKISLPRRTKPVEPAYPADLKAQGIEADVPVMVNIDTHGRVVKVKILEPSSYPAFNRAAEAAAHAERFEPARRGDTPIPYTISYTYRFRIQEQ